eukprot:SAG11_NODE_7900_length_1083_cov_0.783537_2_plen_49_part_00
MLEQVRLLLIKQEAEPTLAYEIEIHKLKTNYNLRSTLVVIGNYYIPSK